MFFGINLNQALSFPFQDSDSRKHFLIGCLVSIAAFIIPILPFMILYGYAIRIVKQVLNNESPRMVPWEDWSGMLKDGAKMFGVRIIYSIPILILTIPMLGSLIGMSVFMSSSGHSNLDALFPVFILIFLGSFCLIMPISLPLAVIIPAAEIHVVETDDFSAGFRLREWWPVLRANVGGFIAAFGAFYLATMILSMAVQILSATIILACLIPLLIPAITMYSTLIMYATIAQAYKGGRENLAQQPGQSAA